MEMRVHKSIRAIVTLATVLTALGVIAYAQTNVANPASDLAGQWVVTRAQNQSISGTYTWSVPAKFASGSAASPGIVSADTSTGWQLGSGSIGGSISGTQRFLLNATTGLTVFGTQIVNAAGVLQSPSIVNCGRLTLTTATPVTTADVTAATTLYFTPIPSCNTLTLWDGTNNVILQKTLTEISVAVPATTSTMYDVFAFDNNGTTTLELLAWTNDTTRATALTVQNGFLAKAATPTRRYLGSMRTTAVSGQTEDSFVKRYVWNYNNRVGRICRRFETTATWTYGTATYRQANNAAANQLDIVVGVADAPLAIDVVAFAFDGSGASNPAVSIGQDATTAMANVLGQSQLTTNTANGAQVAAKAKLYPAIGRHFYTWLEQSGSGSSVTWWGTNSNTGLWQSGIQADWSS